MLSFLTAAHHPSLKRTTEIMARLLPHCPLGCTFNGCCCSSSRSCSCRRCIIAAVAVYSLPLYRCRRRCSLRGHPHEITCYHRIYRFRRGNAAILFCLYASINVCCKDVVVSHRDVVVVAGTAAD